MRLMTMIFETFLAFGACTYPNSSMAIGKTAPISTKSSTTFDHIFWFSYLVLTDLFYRLLSSKTIWYGWALRHFIVAHTQFQKRCLIITEKVSFNIASEASYVYISNGQKFIQNANNSIFWWVLKSWSLRSNSVTRQVIFNRTKIKCDILCNF